MKTSRSEVTLSALKTFVFILGISSAASSIDAPRTRRGSVGFSGDLSYQTYAMGDVNGQLKGTRGGISEGLGYGAAFSYGLSDSFAVKLGWERLLAGTGVLADRSEIDIPADLLFFDGEYLFSPFSYGAFKLNAGISRVSIQNGKYALRTIDTSGEEPVSVLNAGSLSGSGLGARIGAGVEIFMGKHFSTETTLAYNFARIDGAAWEGSSGPPSGVVDYSGISIKQGLTFYLGPWHAPAREDAVPTPPVSEKKDKRSDCQNLEVEISKNSKEGSDQGCCYDVFLTHRLPGTSGEWPGSFRVWADNSSFVSASDQPTGWSRTPAKFPPASGSLTWKAPFGKIPTGRTLLGTVCLDGKTAEKAGFRYAWLGAMDRVLCEGTEQAEGDCEGSCKRGLIRNGGFNQASVAGLMPLPGAVGYWIRGYGSPSVDNDPLDGFIEPGHIGITGNIQGGQSIAQVLDFANKIRAGKMYKLKVAVRFKSSQNALDHGKIRVVAFNGPLDPAGSHPPPSADLAIIGRSGKIRDCGDWSILEFPSWKANKDFSSLAINAFTDGSGSATVLIDDVVLCETTVDDRCDETVLDSKGVPVPPAGAPSGATAGGCQPEMEEEDFYNGSLQDLYPGYDGTTALYDQGEDGCYSLGGTLPPEVTTYDCDAALKAEGSELSCKELQALTDTPYVPRVSEQEVPLDPLPSIGNAACDGGKTPADFAGMAFHGRDIVYVHGLQLNHLVDRAVDRSTWGGPGVSPGTGANADWPQNPFDFYDGYYKMNAISNWSYHIDHFLRGKGNQNRYLIVTYNCSQNEKVAVHGILSQIRQAMQTGKGVEYSKNDPRRKTCFGRDYVMVSMSTGATVADIALSIADQTKTDPSLKAQYGNIGLIADRCKGRVSIRGAFGGSKLAKLLLVASYGAVPSNVVVKLVSALGAPANLLPNQFWQIVRGSILEDLVPEITRSRWGSDIDRIPVPVFTIAGAHPDAFSTLTKLILRTGFDDGVLSMDSSNARNQAALLLPSRFIGNPIKAFDMGILPSRAVAFYLAQKHNMLFPVPGVFAATSDAHLSPNGMVEPVLSVLNDPQKHHYKNHYSFVQATSEHTLPDHLTYFQDGTYMSTMPGGMNNEEELVVASGNSGLFTPGLIDPSIIPQMGERIRGKYIFYPQFKWVKRHGIPRLTITWKKTYIWKRTYHNLYDEPSMYDVDYAYKYLFRQ